MNLQKLGISLSSAVENSSGIIIFSLDNHYRYTSFTQSHFQVMKKIWGVEINVGDDMLSFLSKEDGEKARKNFDKALSGERFTLIEEYGNENFVRSFWENRYDPVKDENGTVIGLVVFVLDISKHIELTRNLENTQTKLKLALESGNIGVWEWDILSDNIYWSDYVYSIYGIDRTDAELNLAFFLSLIHPEDLEKVKNLIDFGSF